MNATRTMELLRLLGDAIVEAVDAGGPNGAPGGILYASLMGQGCTLEQFEGVMSGMVGVGMLCKVGDRYFLGELALERGAGK